MFSQAISPMSKMRPTDRTFRFEIIDKTKAARDTSGMTDPGLFKGENRLHCVMDEMTSLWYFQLEKGSVPQPISGRYTGFRQALQHAADYYANRNIKITSVD